MRLTYDDGRLRWGWGLVLLGTLVLAVSVLRLLQGIDPPDRRHELAFLGLVGLAVVVVGVGELLAERRWRGRPD